jgi:hypothetical protein
MGSCRRVLFFDLILTTVKTDWLLPFLPLIIRKYPGWRCRRLIWHGSCLLCFQKENNKRPATRLIASWHDSMHVHENRSKQQNHMVSFNGHIIYHRDATNCQRNATAVLSLVSVLVCAYNTRSKVSGGSFTNSIRGLSGKTIRKNRPNVTTCVHGVATYHGHDDGRVTAKGSYRTVS